LGSIEKRRFWFGVLLAWAPLLFVVVNAFSKISSQKTSGLGAVAGGISYGLSLFGLVAAGAFQIAAITLLVRACSRNPRSIRIVVVAVSVCAAAATLLAYAVLLWQSLGFGVIVH
jgi:hypothetical protein